MSSSEKMILLFFWNFRHFRIFSRDDWKGYFFLLFNGICNFILDAIDNKDIICKNMSSGG